MKPEQWRLDLYQDLFSFAPYGSDLARAFVAVEMDEVPEADEDGRRRCGGYKLTFEGVVEKGQSSEGEPELELEGGSTDGGCWASLGADIVRADEVVLSLTHGLFSCSGIEADLDKEWTNFVGALHGAAAAYLVDV